MKYRAPGKCPVCNNELTVSRLSCSRCGCSMEGEFSHCKFCQLPAEQIDFIEVFLRCRGNIKEVEKELGISYPTVRNRLETVIQSLGYKPSKTTDFQEVADYRSAILSALEKGEITPQEALEQLKKLGR